MGCKLTTNIKKGNCAYSVAGVKSIYLINYGAISDCKMDADGAIETLALTTGESAYKVEFIENTASFTDDLAVNGNGGKYRTHTVNFTLNEYDYKMLNQGDNLSLGKFIAVIVDKSVNGGRAIMLGRNNGLSATAFNYASGAADADANGWTVTMAGTEIEIGRLLKGAALLESLVKKDEEDKAVVTP